MLCVVFVFCINIKFKYCIYLLYIQRKRPDDFVKYFQRILEIISEPDYVGVHPSDPDSVEFVKVLDDDILGAVKLAPEGYLYKANIFLWVVEDRPPV